VTFIAFTMLLLGSKITSDLMSAPSRWTTNFYPYPPQKLHQQTHVPLEATTVIFEINFSQV